MAHLMKSTRAATGGLTRHFERFKNEKGEYLKFGNQEIDIEKIYLNYNLADDKDQLKFIKQRTSEVRCLNRKDVNIMANWVVTLPETLNTQEDQEKFFKESYKFLEEKYGKENVISSFVHLDESTPHMHFSFIPVVYDKKKEEYKVSAKECINRNHLKRFHPELENHMEKVFGRDIGILNEKTKEGNKTIEELKKETAVKKLNSLKQDIKDKELALNSVKKDLKDSRLALRVTRIRKADVERINQIEAPKSIFNKDKVTLLISDYQALVKVAKWSLIDKEKEIHPYKKEVYDYRKENDELKIINNELNEKLNKKESLKDMLPQAKEKAKLFNENSDLRKINNKLMNIITNNNLTEKLKELNKSNEKSFER